MSMSFEGEVAAAARRIDETQEASRSMLAADLVDMIPSRRRVLSGLRR
jgi:hypothetical protein